MRVYKIHWYDNDIGRCQEWAGSKREARELERIIHSRYTERIKTNISPIDIGSGKKSLIDWLNVHFTSDNG